MLSRSLAPFILCLCAGLGAASCGGSEPEQQTDDLFESAPIGPEPAGSPAKHAFVLHHGFAASSSFNGFVGVAEALRADGHLVYVAEAPPFQPAVARAEFVADAVDQAIADGAEKVNIIAHSMGGLDCRALVSTLGYGDVVATLTTISTPHRGTGIADAVLKTFGSETSQNDLLEKLVKVFGMTISDVGEESDLRAALGDMSEANQEAFNANLPNDSRVRYFSVAGVSNVAGIKNPKDRGACDGLGYTKSDGSNAYPLGGHADRMDVILKPIAKHVSHGFSLTPNDGVVTVESAKWGEFLGCIPADHADEVGQFNDRGTNFWTGFNHVRFYRNHAYNLAAAGY